MTEELTTMQPTPVPVESSPIFSNIAIYVIISLVAACTLFFTVILILVCISGIISSGGSVNPVAHMNDDGTYDTLPDSDDPSQM
jgi:hypothetical protein